MPAEAVKYIGDKLCVGPVDYSFIPVIPAVPGTSVLNGPVWIGLAGPPVPTANCMIGPGLLNPVSLQVIGINNFLAVTNQIGLFTCTGASIFNGVNTINGKSIFNANVTVNASQVINGSLIINGATHINGFLSFTSSIVGTTKKFDIPHPSKVGWRLSHGCLEGPEYGVYYRGILKNTNIITLPKYWKDLVHSHSITVSITPIQTYQNIVVKEIHNNKVYLESSSPINCYYHVFGQRKDIKNLTVEYEGTEPKEDSNIDMEE
jgi:hypothetical protein